MTKGIKIYCYHFSKSMYEKRSKKLLLLLLQIYVQKKEPKSTAITSLNLCTKKGARRYYYCFFKSMYEKRSKNLQLGDTMTFEMVIHNSMDIRR